MEHAITGQKKLFTPEELRSLATRAGRIKQDETATTLTDLAGKLECLEDDIRSQVAALEPGIVESENADRQRRLEVNTQHMRSLVALLSKEAEGNNFLAPGNLFRYLIRVCKDNRVVLHNLRDSDRLWPITPENSFDCRVESSDGLMEGQFSISFTASPEEVTAQISKKGSPSPIPREMLLEAIQPMASAAVE